MPEQPLYQQIAQELRQKIASGELRPGDQLPTEESLRKEFGASRNTIREAVRWLVNWTLVETRPGQGTFVMDPPKPFITTLSADPETGLGGGEGDRAIEEARERGRHPRNSEPRVEIRQASEEVARRLRVPEKTVLVVRHQDRFLDDLPWSLQTSYYPMDLIQQGAQALTMPSDVEGGTVAYLNDAIGLVQVGYRDRIQVVAPNQAETAFFRLPDDGRVPIVRIIRTAYRAGDDGPVPFRLTYTVLPADRNQLVINYGETPGVFAAAAGPR